MWFDHAIKEESRQVRTATSFVGLARVCPRRICIGQQFPQSICHSLSLGDHSVFSLQANGKVEIWIVIGVDRYNLALDSSSTNRTILVLGDVVKSVAL